MTQRSGWRYLLPVITSVVLIAASSAWLWREHQHGRNAALSALRSAAQAVSAAMQGSIQSDMYSGRLRRERLQQVLEGVVATTGVRCVRVNLGQEVLAEAGEVASIPPQNTGDGDQLAGNVFLIWQTVRLQQLPPEEHHQGQGLGQSRGRGWGRTKKEPKNLPSFDIDLGEQSQLVVIGYDAAAYFQQLQDLERRFWINTVVGAVAIVAICLVWGLSLRGQRLKEELLLARTRAEQLAEFELAAFGLAHETKHPLGIIRGLAQQLVDADGVTPETVEKSWEIMEEADVAVARLGDFMQYAKTKKPELKPVSPKAVADRVAELLRPEFDAAGVTLDVNLPAGRIDADEEMLTRVFINLLNNALQACKAEDQVQVAVAAVDNGRALRISDTGSGIAPDLLPNIFKPYVTGRPDGHGIGLAIVKRIIEEHGWRITVDSTPAQGTSFTISGMTWNQTNG